MVPVYVAVTLLLACGGQLRSIQKTKRAVNVSKAVAGGLQLHKVNLPVFILHLLLRLDSGFFKTQMESQLRFFQLLPLLPSPSLSSLFSAVVSLKTSGPHLASPLQTSSQPPLLTPPSVKTCPPLRSGPTSSPPCSTCLEQQWRTGAAHCSASWSRSRRYCWLRCTGGFTRSHDHEEQVLKRSSDSDCCGFFCHLLQTVYLQGLWNPPPLDPGPRHCVSGCYRQGVLWSRLCFCCIFASLL